jgi:hypothetical protein
MSSYKPTSVVQFRATPQEIEVWRAKACAMGQTLSSYIRAQLNAPVAVRNQVRKQARSASATAAMNAIIAGSKQPMAY